MTDHQQNTVVCLCGPAHGHTFLIPEHRDHVFVAPPPPVDTAAFSDDPISPPPPNLRYEILPRQTGPECYYALAGMTDAEIQEAREQYERQSLSNP